ncbi:phosphotransferase [Paenactinomyces guangxiensis]|uniref:Phosphotransferase n=1 Tax=Paenactinomyces guangxiensis TaxID=1490290 RepID=A0A7W2A7P4_9BACL|nr:phosphotransferase [Paenactinomyces guangxiensis]MBA4492993.1 phosphotransferase [Paenactinomyces guangxiensis]MBH8590158.1 phosphotransferase [Paenactinomyces guangxiensis]
MEQPIDLIKKEIIETIQLNLGVKVKSSQSISRGWLNFKWKLKTDQGVLFAKQYHPDRFTPKKLEDIKIALEIQAKLNHYGVACPKPYALDDTYLMQTPTGTCFVVMEFSEGELVGPGKVNVDQIYDLGKAAGYMHLVLSRFPKGKLFWIPSYEELLEKWDNHWTNAQLQQRSDRVLCALEKQKKLLDQIDMEYFKECRQGWAHWDLWVDNILFFPEKVAAILDFDRMKYVFPELDISRAILSCAFSPETGMNFEAVAAFLAGYNQYLPFPKKQLARSLRLSWCQESSWWITHDIEERSENPARFFEEIIWISDHWHELEEIFASV